MIVNINLRNKTVVIIGGRKEAQKRITLQMPQQDKEELADFIIDNSTTLPVSFFLKYALSIVVILNTPLICFEFIPITLL